VAPRESAGKTAPKGEVDPACSALWKSLEPLDLDKNFQAGPNPEKPFPTIGACATLPPYLAAAHDQFAQYCGGMAQLKTPAEWAMAAPQCQAATLLYRAKITDWNTRNVPLKEITDPKILADKLMAKFTDNPAGSAEAAERLLEVDPKLGFAAQASAMGRFMDAQGSGTGKETDDKWDKATQAVTKMDQLRREAGQAGADAEELKLLISQRKNPNPTVFRDEAVKLAETNPRSWVGPYYAAWGEHLLGNADKAREWLETCARSLPHDPHCRQAKGNLASGQPHIFQSHVTIGLNPLAP